MYEDVENKETPSNSITSNIGTKIDNINNNKTENNKTEINEEVIDENKDSKNEYTSEQIQVLEGLEPVRKRPGMYIASTGEAGLHHMVFEVVDNSIDEVLAGRATKVTVRILPDEIIEVIDDGAGIPVDIHPQEKISALELVMTKLHAGGKMDDRSAYKISGGLHGVGVSVVNALSEWCKVWIHRDGKVYFQEYERGEKKCEVHAIGETDRTGTTVHFKADGQILETTTYVYEKLAARLKELSFLNSGVYLEIEDKRTEGGKKDIFHFEGGIASYVKEINKNKPSIFENPIYYKTQKDDVEVEFALLYNDAEKETIYTFVNNIHTQEGGSHLTGFKSALTKCMNEFIKKLELKNKFKSNLSGEDTRAGLVAVISVKMHNPQFEAQTKNKLGNPEIKGILENVVTEGLQKFFDTDPNTVRNIVEKAIAAYDYREKLRKFKEQLKKSKSLLSNTSLPGKLADCSETDPVKCELFIVEGDSAGGSAKQGRNRDNQAVLPLWGKMLNVEKIMIKEDRRQEENSQINSIEEEAENDEIENTEIDNNENENAEINNSENENTEINNSENENTDIENSENKDLVTENIDNEQYRISNVDNNPNNENKSIEQKVKIENTDTITNANNKKKNGSFNGNGNGNGNGYNNGNETENIEKIIDNDKLKPILQSIGTGIGDEFNLEKLRYHKIIIMADADVDGSHINTLLLTFFYNFFRELINHGHIYIAMPPLYKIQKGKQVRYAYSDRELNKIKAELKVDGTQNIQRYKGLGEMNAEQLWETTMNPESRILKKVTLENFEEARDMIETLMGKDVEKRRKYIEDHAETVKDIDV